MDHPILKPIPINTRGLSLLMRIWTWLFSVRTWELMEDWSFRTKIDGEWDTVFIEKGFVFDGASIPRPLWWLLQPMGILLIPGLVHDYAYRYQKITTIHNGRVKLNRYNYDQKFWDILFRDISIQVNECKVISYLAWSALYVFGGMAWKKNRKLEQQRVIEEWKKLAETAIYYNNI